jgi:hypothetical protein
MLALGPGIVCEILRLLSWLGILAVLLGWAVYVNVTIAVHWYRHTPQQHQQQHYHSGPSLKEA